MARRCFFSLVVLTLIVGAFYVRRQEAGLRLPVQPRFGTTSLATPQRKEIPAAARASSVRQASAALFTYVRPENAAALDAALPAPSQAIHYVRLNSELIAGPRSPFWHKNGPGRFSLPLPGGESLTVVIDNSEMLGADRLTSSGRIAGQPGSRATVAYPPGFLHATIQDPQRGNFALRAATEAYSQFYHADPELVAPCGGTRRPPEPGAALAATMGPPRAASPIGDANLAAPAPPIAASRGLPGPEVHVMVAYTPAVLSTLTGAARTAALQSAFDLEIKKANDAFAVSEITARLKLVKIVETSYDENRTGVGEVQNEALTALQDRADGHMDELHALRDQVGADLVCLILQRTGESSGLAFLLSDPTDSSSALFVNAQYGFSVVQYGAMVSGYVMPHEFGHNLGCEHDRENASSVGAYSYSYGYRFRANDGRLYRDIMAYDPGTQLGYFSNPNIQAPAPAPAGWPGGVAIGQPLETDNSLTIEQNAFLVANYRLQTQGASNLGTLINVSTRAFVGTGEDVLIGGFVVGGTTPKRMLIRAAGPALAAYGVTNWLADPMLRISPAAQTLANDNWSEQPNSALVATTAAQVGAFPFGSGSRDAALLLTLAPGAYTAVVEGVGGLTGVGLVEAYDVDRDGTKVVNLSTRGYADNAGKEMFGGFVVQGAPGSTKRILVRVLGPTLARFGITRALHDPYMELRDAKGSLLIQNDDWSSGAAFPDGVRDDFQPVVEYYNEQQISATGFAPSNRREPCVMVDLPPGNYTVTAKPFELRDDDPDVDQPAQPGVGIVEVYEINP
jgi:hypothetical protein